MGTAPENKRIVVGVTGASGMPYAHSLLKALAAAEVEIHLILSHGAEKVLELEGDVGGGPRVRADDLRALAHASYAETDIGAPPASGSWVHHGMVVCPCSMASLAAIANGLGSNLIHRSADVALKERTPLVIVPRETPLSRIHLKNMLAADEAGAIVLPACPGFYHNPQTVDEVVEQVVGRILDKLSISHVLGPRWGEE